jgi:hypothetical protein
MSGSRSVSGWLVPVFVAGLAAAGVAASANAQGRGGGFGGFGGRGGGGAPQAAQDAAPVDLTGYWVSIVTEDWIERMSPDSPPSGTGGGRGGGRGGAVATPDPGQPCRAYGAGGSMRVPGRLYISWADENTLQVDMDAGTQTRLFHFNPEGSAPAESTLQGYSVATWDTGGGGRGRGRGGGGGGNQWGSLRVVTTNMTGGYLLSQRRPYSENASLTETFILHSDFGQDYLTVRAELEDGGVTMTSSTFKREPDGSKFSPAGCEVVR